MNIQDKFESACLESRRVGCELIIRCKFKSEIESMLTDSLSKSVHPIVPSKQASLQTLARNLTHFFPVCLFVYHIRPVTNISECRLNLQTFFLIFLSIFSIDIYLSGFPSAQTLSLDPRASFQSPHFLLFTSGSLRAFWETPQSFKSNDFFSPEEW